MPGVDEETVRVAEPEPPELRIMLVGLKVTVEPVEGETVFDRVTVPEKPLRLARLMIEVAEKPD